MDQTMDDDIRKIISFMATMSELRHVHRFTELFWKKYPPPVREESVPEHTWRMLLLLILIEDQLEVKIDLLRTMKMIIVHDIPELRAGDPSPLGTNGDGEDSHVFCKEARDKKHDNERAACHELFGDLPQDQKLLSLWEEYAAGETNEAKIAKALDKLEATMRVHERCQGHMFQKHTIMTKRLALVYADIDPLIKEITEVVIGQISSMFHPFEPSIWWQVGSKIRKRLKVSWNPWETVCKHLPSWS